MAEKRMLIMPADVVRKIDENRGDMSQAVFIEFLIDGHLGKRGPDNGQCVTRDEFRAFQQGMRDLFRSLLDLFVSVGLETGPVSVSRADLEELDHGLGGLESGSEPDRGERIVKIKWK